MWRSASSTSGSPAVAVSRSVCLRVTPLGGLERVALLLLGLLGSSALEDVRVVRRLRDKRLVAVQFLVGEGLLAFEPPCSELEQFSAFVLGESGAATSVSSASSGCWKRATSSRARSATDFPAFLCLFDRAPDRCVLRVLGRLLTTGKLLPGSLAFSARSLHHTEMRRQLGVRRSVGDALDTSGWRRRSSA